MMVSLCSCLSATGTSVDIASIGEGSTIASTVTFDCTSDSSPPIDTTLLVGVDLILLVLIIFTILLSSYSFETTSRLFANGSDMCIDL
mmetsp:Transcript_5439/g.6124  ORF Transcript_5439/g.6124 Transcript_5439/m.6124 type:complete len:88 (+) Transcript_5439:329-592(+)